MNLAKAPIFSQRSSGVLLHITSLPGAHGSGDLGAEAYHFVDWLVSAGQRLWQILPLSPVGPGNSPYHSPSTFAGNPLLVDLDELVRCGWLSPRPDAGFESGRCDFERVAPYRMGRLREAWQGFLQKMHQADWTAFDSFRVQQAHWLEGYAFFMALEARYGQPWTQWPAPLRQCEPAALAEVGGQMADDLGFFSFIQWRFGLQWQRLRQFPFTGHRYCGGCAYFCRASQRRRLVQHRLVPSGCAGRADRGGRCATRLFQQHRPALG